MTTIILHLQHYNDTSALWIIQINYYSMDVENMTTV